MDIVEATPEAVLGPLNETERRNAPPRLYLAGDATLLRAGPRVSIVGSRRATADGLRRASRLARALANAKVLVLSGLAEGIDTAAHRASIDAGGRTVAVLGTPLDRAYPSENADLQSLIAREHLLISQFPPGMPVRPRNFPLRNRVMALIAHATVIIEAGETSGSLHQGWEALQLGRPLFLAASLVGGELAWPDKMRHYGAQVLSDADDVLDQLPMTEESGLVELGL
ncbi:MAG TPA: DNA-processing protein DprA [Candidatus Polarisedimenticolaceae bacterium]|nr:DNA-processing protein DprA [Candidatus Polarisedimenticolaceae bacterium]